KRWLIQTDVPAYIRFYSYDLTTGERVVVGTLDPNTSGYAYVWKWVGDDMLIVQDDMPEWSSNILYRGTVGVPGSLLNILMRYRFKIPDAYQDNPPRIDFVSGIEGGDWYECYHRVYYPETDVLLTYDMYHMCVPDYGTLDGVGYYRDEYNGQTNQPASL